MKKIAVLMILVLCAVMLGGCMGSGAGNTPVNGVAFVKVSGVEEINLTLDKDAKVIVVTYGTGKVKQDTVYKDSDIVGKPIDVAMTEIVKVNAGLTALNINVTNAASSETETFKAIRDTKLFDAVKVALVANNVTCDVKITSGEDKVIDKTKDNVFEEETESDTTESEVAE